jgi:hypothetical protein
MPVADEDSFVERPFAERIAHVRTTIVHSANLTVAFGECNRVAVHIDGNDGTFGNVVHAGAGDTSGGSHDKLSL